MTSTFRTQALLFVLVLLFGGAGLLVAGPRGALLALGLAAAGNLVLWYHADRIVLRLHRAQEVTPERCPELAGLVHRLARRAGLPAPRVFVIDTPHPNAFATGRDPHHAAVAVTTGLLGLLDRDEIEGVVAHELAHIRHRDVALMTLAATIAGALSMLGRVGGRTRGGLAGLALGLLVAPIAATLVQLAISRQREHAADRAGAAISGKPHALASALERLARQASVTPGPARHAPAIAALYIVPGGADAWFSTHPATADRVARLRALPATARRSALRPSA